MNKLSLVLVTLILLAITSCVGRADHVWIEAENPLQMPSQASLADWGKPELVSGQLLMISFARNQLSAVPDAGITVSYRFQAPKSGQYELWNRVVFSGIRAPFRWRVNGGPWIANSQQGQPIRNIQELGYWNPIGWTPMGSADLKAGQNTLDIFLEKGFLDAKDLRYISDVILASTEPFRPNFKYAPDDSSWCDEKAREAAGKHYTLPKDRTGKPRRQINLNGLWQYAPYDEGAITEEQRVQPVQDYPPVDRLHWYGIELPNDRNDEYPSHRFCHRYVLRTFVDVPEDYRGDSAYLLFEAVSLINSLFVNGKKVDDFSIHYGQWRADLSGHIKAGERNEILVVVKDAFYAIAERDGKTVSETYYFPWDNFTRSQGVTLRFDFPVKGSNKTGIFDEVKLVAVDGPVYIADLYVDPFPVSRGEIEFEVVLRNPTGSAEDVILRGDIDRVGQNGAEDLEALPATRARVGARGETTVAIRVPSKKLELWWPDRPTLHEVDLQLSMHGRIVDTWSERFGNRQWEIRGNQFYLNGMRKHLRANLMHNGTKHNTTAEQALADWRRAGINMFRRRFQWSWYDKQSPRELLAWFDEKGVIVRQNAGTFDGQHASYTLARRIGDSKEPNRALFDNWRAQILNGVKARRNHPSVMIWELDNEIVYINGRNYGNLDVVEPEFKKTSDQVMAMDPTRATVVGGGNALGSEQGLGHGNCGLPTYGIHYFEVADRHYPDAAYTLEQSIDRAGTGEGGKVWPIDFDALPIFMSETAFLQGRNPAQFASVAGEKAFLGKGMIPEAFTLLHEMYATGYRWKETGAVHFWMGPGVLLPDHDYDYWQPVAVLLRQWNRVFGAGEKIARTLKVFNGTRFDTPIVVKWVFTTGRSAVAQDERSIRLPPGEDETFTVAFTAPDVDAATEAGFTVSAHRDGKQVYDTRRSWRILPKSRISPETKKVNIAVWDPSTTVQKRLLAQDVAFTEVLSAEELEDTDADLVIVGSDVVSKPLSTSGMWMRLAAANKRVLVLEQEYPLHYQAVPVDSVPTEFEGRISFSQNIEHPVFEGLTQHDLSFWGNDHIVYRRVYGKPTRGGRSLAHADDQLGYSPLMFAPIEQGGLMLCQYVLGEKLNSNIVAQTLFDNLVDHLAVYRPVVRPTAVAAAPSSPLVEALNNIALKYSTVTNPIEAVSDEGIRLIVVDGTPANLNQLAENESVLDSYFDRGGWLMVMNVTPESLSPFNEIVDYEHLIRPFRMERVTFPSVRDPLTAGLTLRDVVMGSGERIQRHTKDEWPADDAFESIVDIDDVADFAEFPSPAHFNDPDVRGPGSDRWPLNMINGYTAKDHWRLGFSIHLQDDDPTEWTIKLPRQEKVIGLAVSTNQIYHKITRLKLIFDGRRNDAVVLDVEPREGPQTFNFEPRSAAEVTFQILDWTEDGRSDVIGIDDMQLRVQRAAGFDRRVIPMLNIGGLVKYPRGNGGLILNQYRIVRHESNPLNQEKKQTVIATILRNLGAPFSGARAVIAGRDLQYTPVSLESYANVFLTSEQGWPDKKHDLSALPLGRQTFRNVPYEIRDFTTSPLESGVTLAHDRLKSNAQKKEVIIEVDEHADALFFLHTFHQSRTWRPGRNKPEPPVVFEYVVYYSDGTQEVVPIQLQRGVQDFVLEEHEALPDAAVAWRTAGADDKQVAVYQYQWNNPHPNKPVQSVAVRYNKDEGPTYGAPVLLGLTVANRIE